MPVFRLLLTASTVLIALGSGAARAQAPGSSATEKLIELLVEKGILPREQATALLAQAKQEAAQPARAARVRPARAPAVAATPVETTAAVAAEKSVPPGTVRVTYVPEIVRRQIADQVRGEVMQQAKAEGWAAPNSAPEWTQRIRVSGDVRTRYEMDLFDKTKITGNASGTTYYAGNFPFFSDFNAINGGSGFDANGSNGTGPTLNVSRDRDRFRLRARLGIDAQIDEGVSAGLRIATGNDNSPVSTNQTAGQNGPFAKYALWLDRAFIHLGPYHGVEGWVGRSPNPFWTSDLLFDEDLNFDGVAVTANEPITRSLNLFGTIGAFPTYNTAFNFSTNQAFPKFRSRDAWLYGVQGGANWRIGPDYGLKASIGFFKFDKVEGQTSSPCIATLSTDPCDTDNSRPLFLQFGNSLFPLRDLRVNPSNPTGPALQYYGLASRFDVLDLHARFDIDRYRPLNIAIEGDFATNLAYSRKRIESRDPVNNRGSAKSAIGTAINPSDPFVSGPNAVLGRVTVGAAKIEKRWDWNVSVAYRYLEPDAVLDGLTDSDFHLGGSNARGFILGGNLGIAKNTFISARYLSANEVSGPPYAVDVIQADLNVRF